MNLFSSRAVDRRAKTLAGFTLIELLVVVAIIAVLISILLPALSSAKSQANSLVCQADLRSIQTAMMMYVTDYNDKFPKTGNDWTKDCWWRILDKTPHRYPKRYCSTRLTNPRSKDLEYSPYAYNMGLGYDNWGNLGRSTLSSVSDQTSRIILFCEGIGTFYWNSLFGEGMYCGMSYTKGGRLGEPHNAGQNIAYLDGHVRYAKTASLIYSDWEIVKK